DDGGDEDTAAGDDGRAPAGAGDFGAPGDVLGAAPGFGQGGIFSGGEGAGAGAAELRPDGHVGVVRRGGQRQHERGQGQDSRERTKQMGRKRRGHGRRPFATASPADSGGGP